MVIALQPQARLARAAKFGVVGVAGLVVNLVAQALFAELLGLNYLVAALLATQVSSTVNFVMADLWVFDATQATTGRSRRYLAFVGMNNAALVLRAPMMWLLTSQLSVHYSLSNLVSLAVMTVIRFGIADTLIWKPSPSANQLAAADDVIDDVDTADDLDDRARRRHESIAELDLVLASLGVPMSVVAEAGLDPSSGQPSVTVDQRSPEHIATRVVLVVIVAIAAVFRLVSLAAVGFNSDEAVYAGQGAALFGVGNAADYFSLFRAHPLLLQAVVGATYRLTGQSDFAARAVVAVLFGIGSVLLTFALGRRIAGTTVGLIAAGICAVLPYHVIISRQVLVDTAMGFFAVLALWLIIKAMTSPSNGLVIAAFAAAGGAAIAKEIAVLLAPILLYAIWRKGRWPAVFGPSTWWAIAVYVLIVLPFPLTRLISQSRNASAFFLWQFSRDPNHGREWFGRVMLQYATPPVIALIVIGAAVAIVRRRSADRVMLAYVGTFALFFTAWPTKLFPYLFPLVPPMCVFAADAVRAIGGWVTRVVRRGRASPAGRNAGRAVAALIVAPVLVFSAVLSWRAIETTGAKDIPGLADFDVEVQSFAGTREFAEWARTTPTNARFMTIGPSLGNILRFYGERDSVAMSVSVDPLKRNPAYVPIPNPDLSLREMHVQYVVWDGYSADRSSFYSERTLRYARGFGGTIVFSAYTDTDGDLLVVEGPAPDGIRALIVVYSIVGGPLPIESAAETEPLVEAAG